MRIPLIKPFINQEIKDKVEEVLDSGYLTEGHITKEFETKLKKYLGCKYLVTVTSATTGLEVAIRALNIGVGDEVIVPDFTYPATSSVVLIVGATAVHVDVDKETSLIDYNAIESAITKRTKAIIPVSQFGSPLDYERLNSIKKKYGLYIVEDAACSIGAEYNGARVGTQADFTIFSLHPRKFITTGEGGIITTQNAIWGNWINSYKHFGIKMDGNPREAIKFEIIGTNYKLSNILAAVGLGQLNHIDKLLERRIHLANNYIKLVKNIDGICIPTTLKNGQHSYQTFAIYVENRDRIMKEMRNKGIEVQIGTYALHMHKAFQNNTQVKFKGNLQNSKWCYDHLLALPLYNDLTLELQEEIIEELKNCL